MVKDGCDWPAIVRLSQLGGNGSDDRHAHENLIELLCRDCGLDAFLSSVPGKAAVSEVLKPTSMFNMIRDVGGEDAFKLRLGADPVEVEAFWSSLFASTDGKELQQLHPHLSGRTPHELRFSIPLIMHEDAGPYGAALSCHVASWSSVLGRGTELQTKYLYGSYSKESGKPNDVPSWNFFLMT